MDRATREPTPNNAVERHAAVLIIVETIVLIFAGLPAALVFLAEAQAWQVWLYAVALGLGFTSLGAAVGVFWPRTTPVRKAGLLFSAFGLLFVALFVGTVWVMVSVVAFGNGNWAD